MNKNLFFAPNCSKVASNKRNALEWTVANLFCAILHFGQDWSSFREQRVLQTQAFIDPMSLQLPKLQNLFVCIVRLDFCTFYLRCHLHIFQNIATVHIRALFVKVSNCETRYPISLLLPVETQNQHQHQQSISTLTWPAFAVEIFNSQGYSLFTDG